MFEVIELGGVKTVTTKAACNHVYVVDVSGSMYHDLPAIRQHLKNIISMVAQPQDTFTVIYFSGRGQCGVVFENVLVSDVSTVTMMHDAIDRFIKPIGLTGFVDPIKKTMDLNLDPSKVNNFIMLTDGYDNTSSRQDILSLTANLKDKFKSVTFIEYGYYADRELLGQMANNADGTHIFADGIINYERALEAVVSGTPRVNNIEVNVNKRAKHCVYIYNGRIHISKVTDGVVSVPEDVERVHSIVPSDVLNKQLSEDHLFLILFYAAKTQHDELVWNCLQALGEVNLVEKYQNAFTKQELSDFESAVEAAVLDNANRFLKGKNLNAVPDKNAPTVLDLLTKLADLDSYLVTSSPLWSYTRTSRGSSAEEILPRFVPSGNQKVSLRGLVFNSERPNVSINTTLDGIVQLPENEFGMKSVSSFVTRNYTIIRDGIRNVKSLPVLIPVNALPEMAQFNYELIETTEDQAYLNFDLSQVPVTNRKMVDGVSLAAFTDVVTSLEDMKARLKVISHLIKENGGSTGKITGLIDRYGEDAAKWLSEIGIRDYGFSPVGTKSDEATDEYESVQVVYKIKGLSSLPSIDAVRKKIEDGKKLNIADSLIQTYLNMYESKAQDELETAKADLTKLKRIQERVLAGIVYALVLGRKWFGTEEEVETTCILIGQSVPMTVQKIRKMIKL